MKLKLDTWKIAFEHADVPVNFNMEVMLAEIQSDMEDDWDCRYPDKTFIEEFLLNKDDIRYQKLLIVLRDFIDEGILFYPELTRRQAIDWALKRARNKQDSVLMSAFQSLTVNHKQRMLIFGF